MHRPFPAQNAIRLGIIGLGHMGASHARQILAGKVPRLCLAAVADSNPALLSPYVGVSQFSDASALIRSGMIDAVLIATPHYAHTDVGIAALKAGLHVLVEKPISVHKADAERLLAAHTNPRQVFAAMFNQRTDPQYRQIRSLVRSGDLGSIQRVNWIVTNWFRPQVYYDSASWRGTWAGEGGGVLLNQCPHNLDLLCWIFGPPERVRAHCHFGKHHRIGVEDEVTAYCEFRNGATGVFITSTGEAPGTNRLEITGDLGRLVYDNNRLVLHKASQSVRAYSRTTTEKFGQPSFVVGELPVHDAGGQHNEVLANFAAAILDGEPLIAPAHEGLHSVELANAMLLSTWSGRTIELPMSATTYSRRLKRKIAEEKSKTDPNPP